MSLAAALARAFLWAFLLALAALVLGIIRRRQRAAARS